MKQFNKLIFSICAMLFFVGGVFAEEYPGIVVSSGAADKFASFSTVGVAEKKGDVEANALKSLFHTLFYVGVDGVNDGKPLISSDSNSDYIKKFFASRYMFFVSSSQPKSEPAKNASKMFQVELNAVVLWANLLKELGSNGVYKSNSSPVNGKLADVDNMTGVALPTIIVVPYKNPGESYASILQNDFDRRIAISKVQAGFESRGVKTIDLPAKLDAMRLRAEYEASTASSNDKNLLTSSGADVYVTVDLQKDVQPIGSRISLIMKAYETSSGTILATKDGFTRRFNTSAIDQLCAYAVADNLPSFMDNIVNNLNKNATSSSRVVLQVAIGGNSMMTMDDQVGANKYRLSDVIRQWVRKNAEGGKYHLQGVVAESMIFDYVMIPPKDSDGLLMDAAQFAFLLHSYLSEEQGVSCSSRVAGTTIYITIE